MKKIIFIWSVLLIITSCNQVPSGNLSGILDDNSQEVQLTKELMKKYQEGILWK